MVRKVGYILALVVFALSSTKPVMADTVKMSRSKICHGPSSPYYEKVSNKTVFDTMEECLKQAGARLPRTQSTTPSINESLSLVEVSLTEGIQSSKAGRYIKVALPYYTLWVDCKERAAVRFAYRANRDAGNEARPDGYYRLPEQILPRECQQYITGTYRGGDTVYHQGHLSPSNHFEMSRLAKQQANFMINILPQTAIFNRGAWYHTEMLVECYRDEVPLLVYGGVIWGDDATNDHFVKSHGVRTPDFYWKIIQRSDNGNAMAFVIPNSDEATDSNTSRYLVSIEHLEGVLGASIELPTVDKQSREELWPIPAMCNIG